MAAAVGAVAAWSNPFAEASTICHTGKWESGKRPELEVRVIEGDARFSV